MSIFTENQVRSINEYQHCGMYHPFTCGFSHDGDRDLVATVDGLKCPTCGYNQEWAHEFTADWSWKAGLERSAIYQALVEREKQRGQG